MLVTFILSSCRRTVTDATYWKRYVVSVKKRFYSDMTNQTSLIIEQVNASENDLAKIKYSILSGNKTFNEFILSYPSGAYTGMRTVHRDAIVELNTHMKRITNSISRIAFEGKTALETEKAHDALASFRDPVTFEKKLIPLLKTGLEAYYETVDPTTHTEHPHEAKVSLVATYSFETHQPCFAAHITDMPSFPPHKRVRVEIEKKSRTAPEIKDSQWVRERQTLENNKPKDVNEIILMDDRDQLYEGMASNFLVVMNKTVYCASLDHVLLGSILKIVLDICKKHDIPFKWEFPKLEDLKQGKWEGCFITSTSRLLLPVEAVYIGHENVIEFKESSQLIDYLRAEVKKEIYNAAYKIL